MLTNDIFLFYLHHKTERFRSFKCLELNICGNEVAVGRHLIRASQSSAKFADFSNDISILRLHLVVEDGIGRTSNGHLT